MGLERVLAAFYFFRYAQDDSCFLGGLNPSILTFGCHFDRRKKNVRNVLAKAQVGIFYSIHPINGAAIDSRWGWGLTPFGVVRSEVSSFFIHAFHTWLSTFNPIRGCYC